MKKVIIKNFLEFLKLLEEQRQNKNFEFSNLDQVIMHLSMSDQAEEIDSVIPIGVGEFVALISWNIIPSYNIIPDELEFVNKVGNFTVIIMEFAHLNRVFLSRNPLITWTRSKE